MIGSEKKGTDGKDEILVPLTSSLYVKGHLTERGKVLVDVGTGFYVEKVGFCFPFLVEYGFCGRWIVDGSMERKKNCWD